MRKVKARAGLLVTLALACSLGLSACTVSGEAADPSVWGYDKKISYDALGGVVNAREVRTTYYLPNSYVFEPSGSSGMLVAPARDGYVLAGWYTAKSDAQAGSAEEYFFADTDRWDFYTDRVQEDTTLYARWLPRGKVSYLNADTGEVVFTKNITQDSPIQQLSPSILTLNTPAGTTFEGYYADPECTTPYDFTGYHHVEPRQTEAWLYAKLYERFPQYLERIDYVAPQEDEEKDSEVDTSWLFLNRLGYNLKTTDEAAIAELDAAKDQLVGENIQEYLKNTANRVVYLKFTKGGLVRVTSANDLKVGNKYGFFDTDAAGAPIEGYSFANDIDFSGISFTMSDSFVGTIEGNGHKISNLKVSVSSKKMEQAAEKTVGLIARMEGATINDLTIENAILSVNVNPGVRVTGGLLAVEAKNVTLNNCHFNGLTITGGKGDDGQAKYTLGDLFGSAQGVRLNDCTAQGLKANVRSPQDLILSAFK